MARRWLPFRDLLPVSSARPLQWNESEHNAFASNITLDILQQVLRGDPVGVQHTYVSVLLNTASVSLAGLRDGISLHIQGVPHQKMADMVLNAPLGKLEAFLRTLAAHTFHTLHFVTVWAGIVAVRDAYVLSHHAGMATDVMGSVWYYSVGCILAVCIFYLEDALFPQLKPGVERLAACYHRVEFARVWSCRQSPFRNTLISAAAKEWACAEADISAYELHLRTSFSAVRAITNVMRGDAGQRWEDAPLALDLHLPLLQNLRDAGQALHEFKVRVHVENEVPHGFLGRLPLSLATYAASGKLDWSTGFDVDRLKVEEAGLPSAEDPGIVRTPGGDSREGSVRRESRAPDIMSTSAGRQGQHIEAGPMGNIV